jgi:hypothetical protein
VTIVFFVTEIYERGSEKHGEMMDLLLTFLLKGSMDACIDVLLRAARVASPSFLTRQGRE